jgi:hypothetical protein
MLVDNRMYHVHRRAPRHKFKMYENKPNERHSAITKCYFPLLKSFLEGVQRLFTQDGKYNAVDPLNLAPSATIRFAYNLASVSTLFIFVKKYCIYLAVNNQLV